MESKVNISTTSRDIKFVVSIHIHWSRMTLYAYLNTGIGGLSYNSLKVDKSHELHLLQ